MLMDTISFYTKLYVTADHIANGIWVVILLVACTLMLDLYLFRFSSNKYITVADRKARVVVDVISISILAICLAIVLIDNYTYWKLTKLGMSYNEIHNLIINLEHACR